MFAWFQKLLNASAERKAALKAAIVADPWLLNCAQNGEQYCGSFERWWRMAEFDRSVRDRFLKQHPAARSPSKDEIKRALVEVLDAGTDHWDIIGTKLVKRHYAAEESRKEKP